MSEIRGDGRETPGGEEPKLLTAWRIVRQEHAQSAFSGIGAQLVGGRFNSVGTSVVYAADCYALALLEVRVHVPSFRGMRGRVAFRVEIPADIVKHAQVEDLPPGWQARPVPRAAQHVGDEWTRSGRSAVLVVPSVVAPHHTNYLLNPEHQDMRACGSARPSQSPSTSGSRTSSAGHPRSAWPFLPLLQRQLRGVVGTCHHLFRLQVSSTRREDGFENRGNVARDECERFGP